ADTYHRIRLPEYAHSYSDEVGKPQVPLKGFLVTMEDKKPVSLSVLDYEREEFSSGYNVYPVPQRVLVTAGGTVFLASQFYKDALTYAANGLFPGTLAEIDYSNYLRGQSVAKIRFYPFQFNPVTGAVDFYKRIRLRLSTQAAAQQTASAGGNGVPAGTASAYKILVNEDGIYRITQADLVAAGVDVAGLDPRTMKMYSRGTEIPIYVSGENDGVFDAADYLEFYAQKEDSRFTYTNAYWLALTAGSGLRMQETTASAGVTPSEFLWTHHFEENTNYWMESAQDDPWFFLSMVTGAQSQSYATTLIDVVDSPQNAVIKASVVGYKWGTGDVTHHLRFYLNDHIIGDASWQNNGPKELTFDVPSYWLASGINTIKVTRINDTAADATGLVLADWFDISYWRQYKAQDDYLECAPSGVGSYTYRVAGFSDPDVRVYDITDAADVRRVSGFSVTPDGPTYTAAFNASSEAEAKYAVVSDSGAKSAVAIVADEPTTLRSGVNRADYIIIACDNFVEETAPLAAYRQSQGLAVKTVKLTDVYDEFNYGVASPYAVKYFLQYAYENWQKPAPTYVLLVGDATYDFRDDEGWGFTNYMPTYFIYNQDFGETATDSWFACFDSATDIFPEMLVGRFPAKTEAQVTAMVNKTIAYEAVPLTEDWTKKTVFVADDESMFEQMVNTLSAQVTRDYSKNTIYLGDYANVNDCKQDIRSAFNSGALLVTYAGHGSIQLWAEEEIFTNASIASLTNAGKYPFVAALNCVNGYFVYPETLECLAEELLLAEDKGAVAVLAASGMSLSSHQQILAEGLFDSLFKQKERILGSAAAKSRLYLFQEAADSAAEALQQFNLFGDPALVLRKEALTSPAATAAAVYSPVKGISSFYSLDISRDALKIYPSLVFEEEKTWQQEEQKPAPKGRKKPAEIAATTPAKNLLIERLTPQPRSKTQAGRKQPEAALSGEPQNRVVRLGPVPRPVETPAIQPIQKISLSEAAATRTREKARLEKQQGAWQRIFKAVSDFWNSMFKKK
ncbi:MAG: C25 family cysteine peptidase, partial [Candidatus Omnitrophica bacterium]|nr:C25 family cysteine peptidase [Candidatus Omnitrophota bacterium]